MTSSEMAAPRGAGLALGSGATRAIAVGVWLLSVALALATIVMVVLTIDQPAPDQYAYRGFEASIALPWGFVGVLIALRRPGHRVGWLLLAIGLLAGIQGVVDQYPVLADGGIAPAWNVEWIKWVSAFVWLFGMSGLLIFLPIVFPDGHLLSPRWRPAFWFGVVAVGAVVVEIGASTRPIGAFPLTRDVGQLGRITLLALLPYVLFAGAIGLAVLSLVLRFVRSTGEQRQQIRWVAYGGVVGGLGLGFDFAPNQTLQAVGTVTAAIGAACVGTAILRYRLYEIDLIINRTIVYGALTAILAGVYTASITLSTRLFSSITGERSDAAIVLTTLIVVSLFTPLKARLQGAVDARLKPAARRRAGREATDDGLIAELRALHAELHREGP